MREFPDFHQRVIDQPSTQAVIKRALELGVNFIDTANVYAHGTSEEYVGQSLRNLGVRREDVVLASTVYFNEGKLSATTIAREIEGTLKRLGTDYLDLYIIHRFDYDTPVEETLAALDKLVRNGADSGLLQALARRRCRARPGPAAHRRGTRLPRGALQRPRARGAAGPPRGEAPRGDERRQGVTGGAGGVSKPDRPACPTLAHLNRHPVWHSSDRPLGTLVAFAMRSRWSAAPSRMASVLCCLQDRIYACRALAPLKANGRVPVLLVVCPKRSYREA